MSTVSMRRVELLLFKSDIDAVLKYLGSQQCFQIIYPDELDRLAREKLSGAVPSDEEKTLLGRLDEAQRKLDFIGTFFDLIAPRNIVRDTHLPDEEMLSKIDILYERCASIKENIEEEKAKVDQLAESIHEVKAFAGLSRPFDELEKFSFVSVKIGRVPPEKSHRSARCSARGLSSCRSTTRAPFLRQRAARGALRSRLNYRGSVLRKRTLLQASKGAFGSDSSAPARLRRRKSPPRDAAE